MCVSLDSARGKHAGQWRERDAIFSPFFFFFFFNHRRHRAYDVLPSCRSQSVAIVVVLLLLAFIFIYLFFFSVVVAADA